MKRKISAIILTLLIILSAITITPNNYTVKAATQKPNLYVGGGGPSNYTKIQYALENASSGNTTVFVYTGIYSETLIINKTVNITGEDTSSTIIDAGNNGCVVIITADWVNMSKFTIQKGGGEENDAGIKVQSNNTNISNNIIKNCDALGIYLENSNNNSIYNNTFTNIVNTSTIFLWNTSAYNKISKNNITNCGCAIDIGNGSHHNNITDNIIHNNTYGIYLWSNTTNNNSINKNTIDNTTNYGLIIDEAINNKIFENDFKDNEVGIGICQRSLPQNNTFYHNNFINNTNHVYSEINQTWDNGYPSGGNYWDDHEKNDNSSGIGQNLSSSDGICDTPYYIHFNGTADQYPLMLKWGEYSPVGRFTIQVVNKTVSLNASKSYDGDGSIVNYSWDFGDTNDGTGETVNHTYSQNGTYIITLLVTDDESKNSTIVKHVFIGNDITPPEINSVSNNPNTVGFGFNITITVNVTDDLSGVEVVEVNITYPDNSFINYTMNNTESDIYSYNFSDTWQNGQYNYSIWTVDYANNTNISANYSFNVSANATVTVCTIKDSYGDNEIINLTDPPSGDSEIGYELLNGGAVLHIWNRFDSYYFNTSSGIQLTNHYDEYWSHNVLMLGYYNNNEWNLIYRTDELSGFNKDIDTDNETFVNATLWKNLNYGGYDFRLAIRYHLNIDDNDLTIIPYIKNIDQDDIPYVLGFGWEIKDIQIDMTKSGDYIDVNRTMYFLNQTLDNVYSNLSDTEFYLMENITDSKTRSLYLKWNQSLNYKLQVKSRTEQYNAPVTLFIKIGTLDAGQEKYTEMYWYDADQVIYYFDSFDNGPMGEAWASNPSYMVDGSISNHASTTSNGDVELCTGNNCSGTDLGTIVHVSLRVKSYYSGSQRDTILRPVFGGTNDGADHNYQTVVIDSWSQWFDITYDPFAPQSWAWSDVDSLDCDVVAENAPSGPFTLYCSKVEIRVGYVPYNHEPDISSPVPVDGASGIGIQPVLNITVNDQDGDTMNITWWSNSSGSWQVFGTNSSVQTGTYHQTMSNASVYGLWWYWKVNVSDGEDYTESSVYKFHTGRIPIISNPVPTDDAIDVNITPTLNITVSDPDGNNMTISWLSNSSGSWQVFGTNNSVGNGTYHQIMSNASENGKWWYWKVSVYDGTNTVVSSIFKFYTGCESKIKNTGSTDIKGYLLMQVKYYNNSLQRWLIGQTVVDESSSRVINSGEQLALDTIFNGKLNSWNLSYGNGTYRVYAAFCDSDGYVLRCDDGSYIEGFYGFQVNFTSDSDSDGIMDYRESSCFFTNLELADSDSDGYNDLVDIDPLVDLEVSLNIKRIYASEYMYTWREGESWDHSSTNTSSAGDGTLWVKNASDEASGGYYTRQNDSLIQPSNSQQGVDDFALWNFTVNRSGVYYFWMRSHRDINASSNVRLIWSNSSGDFTIFDRRWDDGGLHYEVSWWTNTSDEWKWSWYGVLELHEGDTGTLNLTNVDESDADYPGESTRDNKGYLWMEVDNILITSDPHCHPSGKGVENSNNHTIGSYDTTSWDPPGAGSAPDFYVKATIAGNTQTSNVIDNKFNVMNDIPFDPVDVQDNVENVPITIELWEEDGVTDKLCDINGSAGGKKCNITYNLKNGTWWGDDQLLDTDFIGRTCGEVDGEYESDSDANVIFEISQNDADDDGITYWQEMNVWKAGEPDSEPIEPDTTNDRYAVIVGAGASCKVKQTRNIGKKSTHKGTFLLYDQGSNWADYSLTVDIKSKESLGKFSDNEEIGVMFRYQDKQNYYILRWKNDGMKDRIYLEKRANDNLITLDSCWAYLCKLSWYRIQIVLDGNNIQVFINEDENSIFDIDDDNNPFTSGSIALFCYKNTKAWFDDVIVIDKKDDNNDDILLDEGFDHEKFLMTWRQNSF